MLTLFNFEYTNLESEGLLKDQLITKREILWKAAIKPQLPQPFLI